MSGMAIGGIVLLLLLLVHSEMGFATASPAMHPQHGKKSSIHGHRFKIRFPKTLFGVTNSLENGEGMEWKIRHSRKQLEKTEREMPRMVSGGVESAEETFPATDDRSAGAEISGRLNDENSTPPSIYLGPAIAMDPEIIIH